MRGLTEESGAGPHFTLTPCLLPDKISALFSLSLQQINSFDAPLESHFRVTFTPLFCTHKIAKSVLCSDTETSATVCELQSILFIYNTKEKRKACQSFGLSLKQPFEKQFLVQVSKQTLIIFFQKHFTKCHLYSVYTYACTSLQETVSPTFPRFQFEKHCKTRLISYF